ncbi:MAG TPA: DsbA family protein [Solirubrobacterales bacterium]|nr:DsbA family protein [Solirubrobacterales bacterium]
MGQLTNAPVQLARSDDHLQGEGPEVIAYLDLGCPYCAAAWQRAAELPLRLVVRHFPVASKHPRAPVLHAAAEAAAAQREAAFFEIVDSIYRDQARIDDPHLWERARRLGLHLDRFECDRRSASVSERVRRDFESGIRAGVSGTPAFFLDRCPATEEDLRSLAA